MNTRGYVDSISRQFIEGWALNETDPAEPVHVKILVNGRPVGGCQATNFREDLKALKSNGTGEYAFHFVFAEPLSPFFMHDIQVLFASNNELLTNGSRRLEPIALSGASIERPQPILVTATGRSGTTLLMQQLSRHHAIRVAAPFPYETKILSYYCLALRTLISEGDRKNSTDPDTMALPEHRFRMGFNPYNHPSVVATFGSRAAFSHHFGQFVPTTLASSFAGIIRDFYLSLRAEEPTPTYFAEKIVLDQFVRQSSRAMFRNLREIILVRDPRDLLCSFVSFWKVGQVDAISSIAGSLELLLSIYRESNPDVLFVKYEDLVLDTPEALRRVFDFLQFESPEFSASNDTDGSFRSHGTSSSPRDSIGRWKHDLDAPTIERCDRDFSAFRGAFAYY